VDLFKRTLNSSLAHLYADKLQAVIDAVPGKNLKVLDVGGGMGRMSIPLSARHYVTLSDLSPQMLEQARPWAGERLQLQVANACDLPFPDHSFDVVLCIDVVPHLADLSAVSKALSELRRVLRPGGLLLIDSTNSVPAWALAFPGYLGLVPPRPRRLLSILLGHGVDPAWRWRVHHYRQKVFVNAIASAGLKLKRVRPFGPPFCPVWHLAIAEA
jgi:ubiquinone/menaquinone biosynthesis C-methylase UbiE